MKKPESWELTPKVRSFIRRAAELGEERMRLFDPYKGDSWRKLNPKRLYELLVSEFNELCTAFCREDEVDIQSEAIDMMCICAMMINRCDVDEREWEEKQEEWQEELEERYKEEEEE